MSDLSPEDEALIALAREGLSPRPEDHTRIKRRLAGSLVGTAAATAALSASPTAAAMTGLTGTLATFSTLSKVVAVAVLGTALAGASVAVSVLASGEVGGGAPASLSTPTVTASPLTGALPAPTPAPASHATTTDEGPSPGVVAAAPRRGNLPEPAPSARQESPTVPREPVALGPRSASPPKGADTPGGVPATTSEPATSTPPSRDLRGAAAETPGPSTLAAEADLLARADAALKGGDAKGALALVAQHAASYPAGVLVEEREAERIVVLCALGRTDDARAAAASFLRDRPRSPMAVRVKGTCGAR